MLLPSRFDPEVSFEIEGAAMRAWPAEEVEEVEGWILRRTAGVGRRRSNSMLPPQRAGEAVRSMEMAFATAEELDFPLVVQVSPAEVQLALDEALEDRGLAIGGRTLVLAGAALRRGRVTTAGATAATVDLELGPLTREWVEAWARISGDVDGKERTAEAVLAQLPLARYARVVAGGRPVAVAIGVLDGRWLGVFSLAVVPAARRRGVASAVMDALEGWGSEQGATGVYLQVEADNQPALELYARRGLAIAHSYHYRS
jgi:ribosomal protein S18 acetylase RimI-like enzyme